MSADLIRQIFQAAAIILVGALLGWFYGEGVVGALLATLLLLGWHLFNADRFFRWLHGDTLALLPDGNGIWARIFARVDFVRSRSKRRNKKFRQLLKELRASAKMFPDGGVILNANNEILIHNQAARKLLGLKKKRDRGQRIDNLIRNPKFVDYLRLGDFSEPIDIPSPIDHASWLSCHLVPYGPDQRLLLVRDITEQYAADVMRRDFVANASHELRTPLTVIGGYLEAFAGRDDIPNDLKLPVAEMQRQSDRMGRLVDDLLRLSELETAQFAEHSEAIDMAELLEAAKREKLLQTENDRNIKIDIGTTTRLNADPRDIESVVSNLLGNAIRHTPSSGEIRLAWHADATGGRLSVQDNGVGIPQDHLPRITERFYRVDAGRGGGGGAGLGLAIVKHTLARYGATLDIQSTIGEGSVFVCHFPKARLANAMND